MANIESISSDLKALWQCAKTISSIFLIERMKYFVLDAIEVWKGTIMVDSCNLIRKESSNSSQPVLVLMLLLGECLQSTTSGSNRNGVLVRTSKAKPQTCLGRDVALFSCLGEGGLAGVSFDLLISSGLRVVSDFISAVRLC